ncbi:hypothetical protein SHAb15599_00195 [Acinetobacter phage SH-Ab 15599]|nr:hypothetical protein SHAb15599_00195 [Acinetobacter phage SH-Ab 15599]
MEGEIASFFATKEQLSAGLVKKADLGDDNKLVSSQLPDFISQHIQEVNLKLSQVDLALTNNLQTAKDYAEAYTDDVAARKADLVEGKVPTNQLPSLGSYPEFETALNDVANEARHDMVTRTDQLERSKATLGEDGKIIQEQLPSYDKIPDLSPVIQDLYDSKADKTNVYTKSETLSADGIAALLENKTYTRDKLDEKLDLVRVTNENYWEDKFLKIGGYPFGAVIRLDNNTGEVYSTVNGNKKNPNVDMTGWKFKTTNSELVEWNGITAKSYFDIRSKLIVLPEMFGDDIILASDYAVANNGILLTSEKVYEVNQEFKPKSGLVWFSNNSTLKQVGAASQSASASGLAPESNVRIIGTLTVDMGNPTVGWGEKCHVRIDSFTNREPQISGFYFDTLILKGGHFNCNGFVMAGGANLVRGKRIECGDSAVIGRVFMAHWGNFQDHYNDNGTYRHKVGWLPTTHPHDCIIEEISAGNLTCDTNDYSGVVLISAGYDIKIGKIEGSILDHTITGKGLLFLTAGDLGFAYANEKDKRNRMRNIQVGSIQGTSYALGIGMLGNALYATVDDTTNAGFTPTPDDYLAKISGLVEAINCFGKLETGNASNILINGDNGGGNFRVINAESQYFYSSLYVRNLANNVVVDNLISKDSKINPVNVIGTGNDPSKLPKNTKVGRMECIRYGVTSSNTVFRTALRNELALNTIVDEIIVTEHGNSYCVVSSANTASLGKTLKVGKIMVLDPSYSNNFLVNNSNPISDPVELDSYDVVSGTITVAVSGGSSIKCSGRNREWQAGTLITGAKVSANDYVYNLGAGAGAPYKYIVEQAGVVGTDAVLRVIEAKPVKLLYSPAALSAGATVVARTGTITGLKLGDRLAVEMDKPKGGTRFYAEVTSVDNFTVYHTNPTAVSVTVESGNLIIQMV